MVNEPFVENINLGNNPLVHWFQTIIETYYQFSQGQTDQDGFYILEMVRRNWIYARIIITMNTWIALTSNMDMRESMRADEYQR